MANSLVKTKKKFSVAIQEDKYKALINNTLGNPKKAERFIAAISSAVAINPALQECDANSIITAALLGETLNLSPSPQLGQYYLVPYDTKNGKIAQFQLGYKGYIQLAIRSGYYERLNVVEIPLQSATTQCFAIITALSSRFIGAETKWRLLHSNILRATAKSQVTPFGKRTLMPWPEKLCSVSL